MIRKCVAFLSPFGSGLHLYPAGWVQRPAKSCSLSSELQIRLKSLPTPNLGLFSAAGKVE